MQLSQHKKTWIIDLLFLAIGIALFFSFFLGSIPLGVPDEARYAEIPREMLVLHDYITPHLNFVKYFEKPALFYWLQAGSIKVFGLSEWAIRLPNALMALLGCLIIYAASRILFDRRTGLLASIILATNILYFGMAHIVTLDMTFSVLVSASLLSFLIASQIENNKRWFCYSGYIFAALAMLTKGLVGIIFPGFIIFAWLLVLNQWRLLKEYYLPSGIILFLIIALPWHILVQLKNPEFFHFYFIDQHFLRYLTNSAGRHKPFWFFIPVLIGGFLPWVTFLMQAVNFHFPKTTLSIKQRQVYTFLLLWPSLIFIFFSCSNSKLVTYLLPIFPALAILVAHYLSATWQECKHQRGIKYGYIALPILIGLLGIAVTIAMAKNVLQLDTQQIIPYFLGIIFVWLGGTLFAVKNLFHNQPKKAFSYLAGSTAVALVLILSQHAAINLGSIKPFAQTLKPILKPNDVIACYEVYYQDLPYYLQRKVTVVDWRGELDFGMQHQDSSTWMINSQQFWQQWQTTKRIYVVMELANYKTLQTAASHPLYLIAQTADDVLLTNQPLPTPAYNAHENRAQ